MVGANAPPIFFLPKNLFFGNRDEVHNIHGIFCPLLSIDVCQFTPTVKTGYGNFAYERYEKVRAYSQNAANRAAAHERNLSRQIQEYLLFHPA